VTGAILTGNIDEIGYQRMGGTDLMGDEGAVEAMPRDYVSVVTDAFVSQVQFGESDRWSSLVKSETKHVTPSTLRDRLAWPTRRRTCGRPLSGHSVATGFIAF
jgi:hypothetical protein